MTGAGPPSVDQMWALSVRDGIAGGHSAGWVRARFQLRMLAWHDYDYDPDISPPNGPVISAAGILAGDDVTLGRAR